MKNTKIPGETFRAPITEFYFHENVIATTKSQSHVAKENFIQSFLHNKCHLEIWIPHKFNYSRCFCLMLRCEERMSVNRGRWGRENIIFRKSWINYSNQVLAVLFVRSRMIATTTKNHRWKLFNALVLIQLSFRFTCQSKATMSRTTQKHICANYLNGFVFLSRFIFNGKIIWD